MIGHILFVVVAFCIVAPDVFYDYIQDHVAWTMLQIGVTVSMVSNAIKSNSITDRSGWIVLALYVNSTIPVGYGPLSPIWLVLFGVLCAIGIIWAYHRHMYDFSPEPLNNENVHITFYKPKNLVEVLIALLGLPYSSVGVYADGKWLRFRRKNNTMQLVPARPTQPKYVWMDTGVKATGEIKEKMEKLVGEPARTWTSCYLRLRCVAALKPLLKMLGKEYSPKFYEVVPGIYAYRKITNASRGKVH